MFNFTLRVNCVYRISVDCGNAHRWPASGERHNKLMNHVTHAVMRSCNMFRCCSADHSFVRSHAHHLNHKSENGKNEQKKEKKNHWNQMRTQKLNCLRKMCQCKLMINFIPCRAPNKRMLLLAIVLATARTFTYQLHPHCEHDWSNRKNWPQCVFSFSLFELSPTIASAYQFIYSSVYF